MSQPGRMSLQGSANLSFAGADGKLKSAEGSSHSWEMLGPTAVQLKAAPPKERDIVPGLAPALELIQQGSLPLEDAVMAVADRRDRLAPLYNCLINSLSRDDLAAQVAAVEARGKQLPLKGCAVVIKDCVEWAGTVTTGGLSHAAMPHFMALRDAPVAQALREAGAVCIGKANLPDLHLGLSTQRSSFGIVKHPMAPHRPVVGSSGGVACSVLLGAANAGIGIDTGGCLSLPSSLCGICGFRPSADVRYATSGILNQSITRDLPGPIALTVEDLQLLDHVLRRSLAVEHELQHHKPGQPKSKSAHVEGPLDHQHDGEKYKEPSKGSLSMLGAAAGAVGSAAQSVVSTLTGGAVSLGRGSSATASIASIGSVDRTNFKRADLRGLRLGVPRKHYYEGLDPKVAELMEDSLRRLEREAGVVLVEGDFLEGYEPWNIDPQVGAPIRSFEILRELARWHYQHAGAPSNAHSNEARPEAGGADGKSQADEQAGSWKGLKHLVETFPGSPLDKEMMMQQLDPSTATTSLEYRTALSVHRPRLQQAFADYFLRHDVQAILYPATAMPSRCITREGEVRLNGKLVPAYATYTRNTAPTSNAGIPVCAFPVGLVEDSEADIETEGEHASGSSSVATPSTRMPMGIQCAGPFNSDDRVLEIARALQEFFAPQVLPVILDLQRRLQSSASQQSTA